MRYATTLWELFGFRSWHDDDYSHIEADVLEGLTAYAEQYESEMARAQREAKRGR